MAGIIDWWVWGDMLQTSFPWQLLYLSQAACFPCSIPTPTSPSALGRAGGLTNSSKHSQSAFGIITVSVCTPCCRAGDNPVQLGLAEVWGRLAARSGCSPFGSRNKTRRKAATKSFLVTDKKIKRQLVCGEGSRKWETIFRIRAGCIRTLLSIFIRRGERKAQNIWLALFSEALHCHRSPQIALAYAVVPCFNINPRN